jgi:hypothetical protein
MKYLIALVGFTSISIIVGMLFAKVIDIHNPRGPR